MTDGVDLNELVGTYIKLRDEKSEREAAHKKDIQAYDAAMEKIESYLGGKLAAVNAESMATAAGTFFKVKKESIKVANRELFYQWAKENNQEDCLDIRAGKANILAYKESHKDGEGHGVLPPGLDYRAFIEVQVRRS